MSLAEGADVRIATCDKGMLRSLLGEIDLDRLCLGIKVGGVNEDILQIFVRAENCAADIKHLCLSQIKSGHICDAVRRGLGGKEYALPS
jgi:hypothetical protein